MTAKRLFKYQICCDVNAMVSALIRGLFNATLTDRNLNFFFVYWKKNQYFNLQANFAHQSSRN